MNKYLYFIGFFVVIIGASLISEYLKPYDTECNWKLWIGLACFYTSGILIGKAIKFNE